MSERKTSLFTRRRWSLFFALALSGCVWDLYTKHLAFEYLGAPQPDPPSHVVIPGMLSLLTNLNTGALFGIGQGVNILFTIASLAAIAVILFLVLFREATNNLLYCIVLGLVMAGALGNLYDRLGLHGMKQIQVGNARGYFLHDQVPEHLDVTPVRAVRDFIYFKLEPPLTKEVWIDWPIFNFADCFLVIGVFLLMFHSFRQPVSDSDSVKPASDFSASLNVDSPAEKRVQDS